MEPLGWNYREYHDDPNVSADGYALPKSQWGDGPWQHEPDKAQWIDEATQLDCLIVRNHFGGLCGYVGVPPEHPLHGAPYDIPDVEVHGGLTFAGPCASSRDERSICHVPAPGRPDDVHWLGFDCGHCMDLLPEMAARQRRMDDPHMKVLRTFLDEHDTLTQYRDWCYVASEVTSLARQLAEVKK